MTPLDQLSMEILWRFRHGKDTLEIAREFHLSEARASRLLWVLRGAGTSVCRRCF